MNRPHPKPGAATWVSAKGSVLTMLKCIFEIARFCRSGGTDQSLATKIGSTDCLALYLMAPAARDTPLWHSTLHQVCPGGGSARVVCEASSTRAAPLRTWKQKASTICAALLAGPPLSFAEWRITHRQRQAFRGTTSATCSAPAAAGPPGLQHGRRERARSTPGLEHWQWMPQTGAYSPPLGGCGEMARPYGTEYMKRWAKSKM